MVKVNRPVKAELCYRIKDVLEQEMKTNIPVDDPARVSRIVVGKYTGDREGIIVLAVHPDHPLGHEKGRYDHGAEGSMRDRPERGWRFPSESIGGSHWDMIYGAVEYRFVLEGTKPENAVEIVETLKARIVKALDRNDSLAPLSDDYGCTLFGLRFYAGYGYASGGDDVSVDSGYVDFTANVSRRRER